MKKATRAFRIFPRQSRNPSISSTFSGKQKTYYRSLNKQSNSKAELGKSFVIWMQLGIVDEQAGEAARGNGLIVVMDKCLMIEHHRLT